MSNEITESGGGSPGGLVLISLVLARFATASPGAIIGLLLLDIGLDFDLQVGLMGQIQTVSSIVSFVFAFLMGVVSVKYEHRKLLLVGLLSYCVASLGCGFSQDFAMMVLFYSLVGMGGAMVLPMTMTLVTELYSPEKRGSVLGYLMATISISFIACTVIIGYISELFGWRLAFLGYALPLFLVSLLLALFSLPSTGGGSQAAGGGDLLDGFKAIRANGSAVAALVVVVLANASWQSILLYSTSFIRVRFGLSSGYASLLLLVGGVVFTVAAIVSGRMVNRFGRKRLSVITAAIAGLITMVFTLFPSIWLSLGLVWLACWFVGMRITAFTTLELEQVPDYRGTMMSLDSAFASLGAALGSMVGGAAITFSGYGLMSLSLGVFNLVAALVIYLYVKDTTYHGA